MTKQIAIVEALYARLSGIDGIQKASPTPVVFANVPPAEQPHMSFEVDSETRSGAPGTVSGRSIRINVYVLARADGLDGPMPVLFDLVERIDLALRARAGETPRSGIATTLGGLAVAARISGTIDYDQDARGQGGCVVPVEIVYTL